MDYQPTFATGSGDIGDLLDRAAAANLAGNHREGVLLAEAVLASPGISTGDQARGLDMLALHHLRLGDFEAAVERGLHALDLLKDRSDLVTLSRIHCTLALAFHTTGLHEKSVPHVVKAMAAAHECGDPTTEFWALSRSAMVTGASGDPIRGIELDRRALALARSIDEADVQFAGLNNLAGALMEMAHDIPRGHDGPSSQAAALYDEAKELFDAALDIGVHHHHPSREASALVNLVEALTALDSFDEARALALRARDLTRHHGLRNLEVSSEISLAKVLRAEGQINEAIAAMEALVVRDQVAEKPLALDGLHEALHQMHKELGNFEEALHHHEQFHLVRTRLAAQTAGVQSRMLLSSLEIEQARHDAQRSRLEATVAQARAVELEREAHADSLTGLPNRRSLDRELPSLVAHARASDRHLCAAMVDLDHFKAVNDTHGHPIGDQVLVVMADILRQATRGNDLAVRVGGEEFLLIFADTTAEQAAQACERLLASVRTYPWGDVVAGLLCTVSAGVAALDPDEDVTTWLARADAALYGAKRAGRDRVVIHQAR